MGQGNGKSSVGKSQLSVYLQQLHRKCAGKKYFFVSSAFCCQIVFLTFGVLKIKDANLLIYKFIQQKVFAVIVKMSRALRMRVCIQEVEDTMKELNERNQICGVLVRAMSSHSNAEDRANYYECFQLNENIRNAEMKNFLTK